MAKPKVIVQIYPMLPAEDRADRERKRPLGRNRDLYQQVLHETFDIVRELDEMGVWGISTIEHHMHSEGYEVGPDPGVLNAWWASQVKNAYVGAPRLRDGNPRSDPRGGRNCDPRSHDTGPPLCWSNPGLPGALDEYARSACRRGRDRI